MSGKVTYHGDSGIAWVWDFDVVYHVSEKDCVDGQGIVISCAMESEIATESETVV